MKKVYYFSDESEVRPPASIDGMSDVVHIGSSSFLEESGIRVSKMVMEMAATEQALGHILILAAVNSWIPVLLYLFIVQRRSIVGSMLGQSYTSLYHNQRSLSNVWFKYHYKFIVKFVFPLDSLR